MVTTGGTGFSPRDVTPEATIDVVGSRLAPAFAAAMIRSTESAQPVFACMSRGVVGIVGRVVVVNVPGNPNAVAQYLAFLEQRLPHMLREVQRKK